MGRSKMESQEKRREPHFDTHHIVLKERKSAMLTGVKEVLSFDSEEVQLDTITGKDLHVRRLTLERGEVDIDGTFDELKYSDPHTMNDTKSFLGRLFQ